MTRKSLIVVISVLLGLCLVGLGANLTGCTEKQSKVEIAYDTIKSANIAVDQTMVQVGKWYRQDKITEDQKEEITRYYELYRTASDVADTALSSYKESQDKEGWQKYLSAVTDMFKYRNKLVKLANKILEEVQDDGSEDN